MNPKKYRKQLMKFKFTEEDLHNLYSLSYMVNWQDYRTIKLNKMDKWFDKFFIRLEKKVVPELYQKKTK